MAVTSPLKPGVSSLRHLAGRLERAAAVRFGDPELSHLRAIQRAYRGNRGPDILIFGDSTMFWTAPGEPDRRQIPELIATELGRKVTTISIVGAGYNPRIVNAYLGALARCRSRPKTVVVPTSTVMAQATWLEHPKFSYVHAATAVNDAVCRRQGVGTRVHSPGADEWERYDAMPAHSLMGQTRTLGELRMIAAMSPTSPWQAEFRARHLCEYYMAERLRPDSPGVVLVSELSRMLCSLGVPSVAYMSPLNFQAADRLLGTSVKPLLARDGEVITDAFHAGIGERGTMVDAVVDHPEDEFFDPAHLTSGGRQRLAVRIAGALRSMR
jgi:hypothetical protein